MRPPPAFQCYASDWLAKEEFRLMTLEERGLLFSMLCQTWVNGSLPQDAESLAKLVGTDMASATRARTQLVLKAFRVGGDGRLVCPELDGLRSEYEARSRDRASAGRKGAQSRWKKAPRFSPRTPWPSHPRLP